MYSSTLIFFTGSIADNLRFANPLANESELWKALEKANACEDVSALPNGLNTLIGQGEERNMSSSLIFRINLARAHLKDSPVILIDELPYALLNSHTGEMYKRFLEESRGHRTIIMVTHRRDFIELADTLVTLYADDRPVISHPRRKGSV